jgi:hypothetical protein
MLGGSVFSNRDQLEYFLVEGDMVRGIVVEVFCYLTSRPRQGFPTGGAEISTKMHRDGHDEPLPVKAGVCSLCLDEICVGGKPH